MIRPSVSVCPKPGKLYQLKLELYSLLGLLEVATRRIDVPKKRHSAEQILAALRAA
jgi:hypothetical protein